MREIKVTWLEDHLMIGTGSNQHSIVIGKKPGEDEIWNGMSPADLLLIGSASCSLWDVVGILSKQRQPLQDLQVNCKAEQKQEPPFNFTKIHFDYVVVGDIKPELVQKAIDLSMKKYCSVVNSLRQDIEITNSFKIIQDQ